jgi:hypothetical protein
MQIYNLIVKLAKSHPVYIYSFFPFFKGIFLMHIFQLCFICHPSDFTMSEDTGIEQVATSASAVRRSNHSAIDLILS